jgi:hypothetical protein
MLSDVDRWRDRTPPVVEIAPLDSCGLRVHPGAPESDRTFVGLCSAPSKLGNVCTLLSACPTRSAGVSGRASPITQRKVLIWRRLT